MNELQPVVDIVRQRLTNGEQLDQITPELIEKEYTSDQIEWIINEVSESKCSKTKFKKYLPYLAIILLLLFVASFFGGGTNLNATQISAEDYDAALSGDVIFNDVFSAENYPEVAREISSASHQVHFDGEKARFFITWHSQGKKTLYDSASGKSQTLSGPWLRSARCSFFVGMSGPSCQYGDAWFVTDNGHVFVYINTNAGNVYKNDKANGLYFFDGNNWSKVIDSIAKVPLENSRSIFNSPNLFLTNEGCSLFFTRNEGVSEYYFVDVCSQTNTFLSSDKRNKVTVGNSEISTYLSDAPTQEVGTTELDPFAVAFTINSFPISCDKIPQEYLSRIRVDMGDGTTLPVTCGFGSVSHSYDKPGTYRIKLMYENDVLFEKVSNISTFVEDVTFDIEIKENDGRFNQGLFYAEITYSTNPVCDLTKKDQQRVYVGSRTKHHDGHTYANDYGPIAIFEPGACRGVAEYPLTTNPNDKDETKTIRFEYVIDGVARAAKDITFPVQATPDSDVLVSEINPNNQPPSNKLAFFPYAISNIQTSGSIKLSEIDYLEVTWDYSEVGISNLVDPMLLFALTDEDGEMKKIGINRFDLGDDPRMKGVAVTASSVQLVPPTMCHEYSASDCREQSYGLDKKYRISVYGGECLNPESNPSYCNGSQKHQFNRHLGDSNWIIIEQ